MPKGAGATVEGRRLSAELAVAEGLDFQRKVLPFIRLIWPETVEVPVLRSFDQRGIDLLAWGEGPVHPLVVQCKGFQAQEHELGASQVRQCLKSIESYRSSGVRTRTYLLVHNRTGLNASFRAAVEPALATLMRDGLADRAELWDRQMLLKRAIECMSQLVAADVQSESGKLAEMYWADETLDADVINFVPTRSYELKADQWRLKSVSDQRTAMFDPAELLKSGGRGRRSILLGEFGTGKTTAVLRALVEDPARVYVIPGAAISGNGFTAKGLLEVLTSQIQVLDQFSQEDIPVLSRLARIALKAMLSDTGTPAILIVDGLDEAPFVNRRQGIQSFLNSLKLTRVPVFVTMRTELWNSRQADFATSVHPGPGDRKPQVTTYAVTELLPWTEVEILELVRRYHSTEHDRSRRERLVELMAAIENGSYTEYFGDIPRRPLFLRMVIEYVAEEGLLHSGRAQLMEEWARIKVLRDFANPSRLGGPRVAIMDEQESVDSSVAISFMAMQAAALEMTDIIDDSLNLLPSCRLSAVVASVPALNGMTDATGLVLNSLLLPAGPRRSGDELHLRFAHRAFQEYFLARELVRRGGDAPDGVALPVSVTDWIRELQGRE